MKTFLLSIFALAIVAAPVLGEDDKDHPNQQKTKQAPPQRQVNTAPRTFTPRVQNNVTPKSQFQPRTNPAVTARTYTPKTYTPNVQPRLRNTQKFTPLNQDAPRSTFKADTSVANQNWQARTRRNPNVITPQTTTTVTPNTTVNRLD
ncbi:MAG: hypothetical protein QOF80_118, partial [Verrucomicrobiota bacterium]